MPVIYQRAGPSVVLVRTSHDLGTGVIVADDGTILTANHVISSGGAITVTFADGTTATATVAAADPKLDVATLTPAKLPQDVVPATLGGGADANKTQLSQVRGTPTSPASGFGLLPFSHDRSRPQLGAQDAARFYLLAKDLPRDHTRESPHRV